MLLRVSFSFLVIAFGGIALSSSAEAQDLSAQAVAQASTSVAPTSSNDFQLSSPDELSARDTPRTGLGGPITMLTVGGAFFTLGLSMVVMDIAHSGIYGPVATLVVGLPSLLLAAGMLIPGGIVLKKRLRARRQLEVQASPAGIALRF